MDKTEYKKNIEATFDDVSQYYDNNRFFAISAAKMADLVPTADKLKILDVSTGTGVVAIEMACKYPDASIEAIDLSQGMLEIAKTKARDKGIPNIGFRQCDVENIAYGKDTFDVATCGYALFFYPDMAAAYEAICKTIKPGGMFIFSSFTDEAFKPYSELFLKRLEDEYKVETPSRMRERLKTKQQFEELASTGTFNSFAVIHEPIRYMISVEEWWSLLNSAGFKSLLNQLDEYQLEQFNRDHLMDIQELSDGGAIELNADTLFGVVNL